MAIVIQRATTKDVNSMVAIAVQKKSQMIGAQVIGVQVIGAQVVQVSATQDAQITGSVITFVIPHATFHNAKTMLEIAIRLLTVIRDAHLTGSPMVGVMKRATFQHVNMMVLIAVT